MLLVFVWGKYSESQVELDFVQGEGRNLTWNNVARNQHRLTRSQDGSIKNSITHMLLLPSFIKDT